jgi:hypothetical protein
LSSAAFFGHRFGTAITSFKFATLSRTVAVAPTFGRCFAAILVHFYIS